MTYISPAMLYSLANFAPVIRPLLRVAGCRRLVEIGAEAGIMTRELIAYAAEFSGELTVIELVPSFEVKSLIAAMSNIRLVPETSLSALPTLAAADAYFIDGDHNYYTVLHELTLIDRAISSTDVPLLAFIHDIGWPFGRRDAYCDPELIPPEFCHPHDWVKGMTPENPGLVEGGIRGMGSSAAAVREGGPRNGVLTAVEDFLAERPDRFRLARVPAIFGLGVLYSADAAWAEQAAAVLAPYDDNPLIAAMERDRLQHLADHLQLIYSLHGRRPGSA
jgi:hypothetical protein